MSLNLNPESTPSNKGKNYKKALRVGGVVSLVGIGSTFAANISLNQGDNVEFGQGVAQTAACDQDGFSITPVSSYDNGRSIFRLDRVQVSGLNLTPVGTGYSAGGYGSQSDAISAHPGQYYDNGSWIRTCDGVVLDFKAYTDDQNYWSYTKDGYNSGSQTISSPVMWAQGNGGVNNSDRYNTGFAVIFDTNDDNNGEQSNYAVGDENTGGDTYLTDWEDLDHSTPASSTFSFGSINDNYWRPDAASISKIAVASMSSFPSDYYVDNTGGIGRG